MSDKVETTETQSSVELICQATKAFWLRDYKEAVKMLGQVSEMLVKEHGDDKYDGLGNVYLYYGKTLLELAREAGDPLGDVVPKEIGMAVEGSEDDDDDDGDDDDEGNEEEGECDAEGEEDAVAKDEKKKGAEDAESSQGDKTKSADISMNGESAATSQSTSDSSSQTTSSKSDSSQSKAATQESADDAKDAKEGETADVDSAEGEEGDEESEDDIEGEKEEDEEPSDLQLAWEVLELAKEIFQKRGDSGKEDYADCLITLGEVSMESENFEAAISDINTGLEIQKEIYTEGKDMRKLAHSHYMLGMALCADNKTAESMTCYETTLRIMKERLALLEALKNPGASDEQEITEVKSLIPEVEEKITDLQTYIEEYAKKEESSDGDEKPKPSSPEKKARNISHLVKRKRDEDAGDGQPGAAAKKPAPSTS